MKDLIKLGIWGHLNEQLLDFLKSKTLNTNKRANEIGVMINRLFQNLGYTQEYSDKHLYIILC